MDYISGYQKFIQKRKEEKFQHLSIEFFSKMFHYIELSEPDKMLEAYAETRDFIGFRESKPVDFYRILIVAFASYSNMLAFKQNISSYNAFNLSDYYIGMAFNTTDIDKLRGIYEQEVRHFCLLFKSNKARFSHKIINQIIEYVFINLYFPITISSISEHLGLTPNYISRLFKKHTGISLKDYIYYVKIQEAYTLYANSNDSLTDITASLGFSDLSHYDKICKKYTGVSPRKLTKEIVDSLPKL